MLIKISRVFLKDENTNTLIKVKLKEPKRIINIVEEMNLEGMGYAEFYLNDEKVNKDTLAIDEDELLILPIVGGG